MDSKFRLSELVLTECATTVLERCDALAAFTEEPGCVTRRFATTALRDAGEAVGEWMEAAGMAVRRDAIGNVIGRTGGSTDRTLLIGSHLDTVCDAGRYDGILGVLIGIACVELLRATGHSLPYAVEVLGFADEEGVRYGTAYLGSSAVAGRFDLSSLERRDANGVGMADALRAFGGAPERIEDSRRDPADLIGYYEVHIEQGPVLEAQNLPLGLVNAIAGQTRATLTFSGQAGHAGTVPMAQRHDALSAAAEWMVAAEAIARAQDGLVATVGELTVQPGASNVIPSRATLSLDLRHGDDATRVLAASELRHRAEEIAAMRGVAPDWCVVQETPAVQCSPELTDRLSEAVAAGGQRVIRLPSGAGHDAAIISRIAPVTMLFVRCAGGISHNPAESVTVADVATAIGASVRFMEMLR
ncbi:MAG TPA: allantoate amidohydrolase [Solirubrobacteraceae bacterium]|nr:allantoate amidohydrolase [Solirubrobacteraceae bacterium]